MRSERAGFVAFDKVLRILFGRVDDVRFDLRFRGYLLFHCARRPAL
jgi:hypothetical protein